MSAPVEAILAEIGKAFRLCRFYPATHPSVQQALASVSSVLPDLVKSGPVELKITPTGFLLGSVAATPRNPPVQELANLLYTQGHRFLQMDPGLIIEEISALIRAASSGTERAMQALGGQAAFEALPHIRLERTGRRQAKVGGGPRPSDGPVLGRRTMQTFRPDALPPDIKVGRLAERLTAGAGDEGEQCAARIGELMPELAANHDFKTLALAVAALGTASATAEALTSQAAALALDRHLDTAAIAGLVSRLGDAHLVAAERDEMAEAVAALGPRAIGPVADAYLGADEGLERDILLAVVRRAGPAAAGALLIRANPDARGEAARAQAQLLGATRSPEVVLILGAFAVHSDPLVREAAIDALARIDTSEAGRFTIGALRDPDARVRATEARGIAWFGDGSAAPILLARLEEEEDDSAATAMIYAIGELRVAGAVDVLSNLARGVSGVFQRHPTPVRIAAIRALGAIGTGPAHEALRHHLEAKNEDVRQAASAALET